jgi:hypothetical protein
MQIKINPLQLVCALLTLLCYCLIPFVYFGIPGIRIPLFRVTALQFWLWVSDWMILPLLMAVLMLIASLFSRQKLTVVIGSVSLISVIVLGVSLSSVLANSDLARLISNAASKISQNSLNLTSIVDVVSSASMTLYFGFYLYLLFTGLFLFFGLLSPGDMRGPAAGSGGRSNAYKNASQANRRGKMYN